MPKSLLISIIIISILVCGGGAFLLFSNLFNNSNSPEVVQIQASVNNDIDLSNYIPDIDSKNIEITPADYVISNNRIKFTKTGNYTIKIIDKNKTIKIIEVAIINEITSISLDFSNCELFCNKTPNSKDFKILDNNTEISLNYVGLSLNYDRNIISIQNNKITALSKGNTILVVECKGFFVSANIIVHEWNYAQSISFEEQTISLKTTGDNYQLSPDISYINSNSEKENVVYTILSGSEFCELNGNTITPKAVGKVEIKASIKNGENSFIDAKQVINIEPLLNLNISVFDEQNNTVSNVKSDTKVDGNYENYKLKIISNIKFNEEIINQIYSFLNANYNQKINLLNYDNQEDTLIISINFKSSGILNLQLNILDIAQNYNGNSISNELQLNQISFVKNINLISQKYVDNNSQEYDIEKQLQSGIEIYTIYNAVGTADDLLCAINDHKPYYVEFQTNVECDFSIVGNTAKVAIDGKKITRLASGVQNILISALDGSGVTKLISVEILDIDLITFDFSNLPTNYTFFMDQNTTFDCTPNFVPCYATNKPAITINLTDPNLNQCATTQGNNIVVLSPTTSSVTAQITVLSQTHSMTFVIYAQRPIVSVLDNDNNFSVVDTISQYVNQVKIYSVVLDGITPANAEISYTFLNNQTYENSYPSLIFNGGDTTSFSIQGTAELSTKLKIILNGFELIIDIVISQNP